RRDETLEATFSRGADMLDFARLLFVRFLTEAASSSDATPCMRAAAYAAAGELLASPHEAKRAGARASLAGGLLAPVQRLLFEALEPCREATRRRLYASVGEPAASGANATELTLVFELEISARVTLVERLTTTLTCTLPRASADTARLLADFSELNEESLRPVYVPPPPPPPP